MLAQSRRWWANVSQALGQRLVFDRLYHRKPWRKMNGLITAQTDRLRPSKHEALNQCWFDAGPASQTGANISPVSGQRLVFDHLHHKSETTDTS